MEDHFLSDLILLSLFCFGIGVAEGKSTDDAEARESFVKFIDGTRIKEKFTDYDYDSIFVVEVDGKVATSYRNTHNAKRHLHRLRLRAATPDEIKAVQELDYKIFDSPSSKHPNLHVIKNDRYEAMLDVSEDENATLRSIETSVKNKCFSGNLLPLVVPYKNQMFADLAEVPEVSFTSFKHVSTKEIDYVEVEFSCPLIRDKSPDVCFYIARFFLDSGFCFYCKTRFETSKSSELIEVDVSKEETQKPILVRGTSFRNDEIARTFKLMIADFNFDDQDNNQFYLPFYGLPEPKDFQPKPWFASWMVFALIGIILLGGSVVFSFFVTKQKR